MLVARIQVKEEADWQGREASGMERRLARTREKRENRSRTNEEERKEERKEGRKEGRAQHLPSSNVDIRQRLKRIGSTNLECVLQV